MYATLLRLYTSGKLSDAGLDNAVELEWIKASQAETIRLSK
jgi:hypothetical protein